MTMRETARWADRLSMAACANPSIIRAAGFLAAVIVAAATLAGCGSDGASAMLVDPARYDGFHCNELVTQWKALMAREKELRNLMDKADESSGGAIIGTFAYRGDYETVLEQEKVLQRTAATQKCQLVPTSTATSDQTIR
jgi:outer membrane murein-binding lipoprotein Lpp